VILSKRRVWRAPSEKWRNALGDGRTSLRPQAMGTGSCSKPANSRRTLPILRCKRGWRKAPLAVAIGFQRRALALQRPSYSRQPTAVPAESVAQEPQRNRATIFGHIRLSPQVHIRRGSMAERANDTMHLVVGWPGRSNRISSALAVRTMADLIATQQPSDFYSIQIVDEINGPSIHCSFASQLDADRLAATVKATVVASYPTYRSQRVFVLDQDACDAICDLIGERNRAQKQPHNHAAASDWSQRSPL
jgi:hypothetical protein